MTEPAPEWFVERLEATAEKASDNPQADFIRTLADTVAQTIPDVNELESGTRVGRVVYLGGTETRFVPAERFRGEAEPEDAPDDDADPDFCREILRAITVPLDEADGWEDVPPIEQLLDTMLTAADRGCISQEDAERFGNRLRGMEGSRFASLAIGRTIQDITDAFDLPPPPAGFTITNTEGETVLRLEEGDAIEVEFINTQSRRRDTIQGVIADIRPGVETDDTRIELSSGATFRPASGASVRINDRRRGLLPRDEPPQENIRRLFGDDEPAGDESDGNLHDVIEAVQERADALDAGDRADGDPLTDCGDLGPYIFAALEPLEREPPSPFDDDVEDLQDALFDLATSAVSWMRRGKCGGSDGQGAVRRSLDALREAAGSNKPQTVEAVRDFRESFVVEAIPPTWTYQELGEQISSITRRSHAGMTTPAAALHIVADVANWLRFLPLAAPPGDPSQVVAAGRQKIADQWPDVRGWAAIERDPDFELRDFEQVWEDALALLVRGEDEAAVPVLLNLRRGILESFGPASGRDRPLDFEFPDERGSGEASTALRGGGEFEPPARVGEWELIDDDPPTWRREGFHLNPGAAVPRPGEVLASEFETRVVVRQSQTRHHIDVEWRWDGERERSRRADVTVGDTRTKAIEQAVEMLAENKPSP